MKTLRRLLSVALILLSVATGGRLIWGVLHEPLWQPFVAAGEDEIRAGLDRALAGVRPEMVAGLIEDHLTESPRNWAALDSLHDLAMTHGIGLPKHLLEALAEAKAADESWTAISANCLACAWDAAKCPLDATLICQGVVALTPLPDLAGVARAAGAWVSGEEIDRFDLALSVVGLTATAAVVVTGGSSEAVKAASGVLRMAKGMGRLSSRLVEFALQVSSRAIDMGRLARGELRAAVRLDELAPLVRLAGHVDEIRAATDMPGMLHLLPLIDDADEAADLARIAKAGGKETLGAAEILGKARLFRLGLRWSEALMQAVAGVLALIGGIASLVQHLAWALVRRRLKRALR